MDTRRTYLPEFEKLTGIKVVVEEYPADSFRQELAVELSAKSKGIDVFTTGVMREGRQFAASGWYADLTPLPNDAGSTSPDREKADFLETLRGVSRSRPWCFCSARSLFRRGTQLSSMSGGLVPLGGCA
jgi:ABC-type glycerol-3-phosphate transport system substrate-binding protein